jgi:chromosome segregation ATPase
MEWQLIVNVAGWGVAALAYFYKRNDKSRDNESQTLSKGIDLLAEKFELVARELNEIKLLLNRVEYQNTSHSKEISVHSKEIESLRSRIHHVENVVTIVQTRCEATHKD